MNWIDETVLLYFFSSLAQCAAGFAALIGVFAVFRLQANTSSIVEEYTHAMAFLRINIGLTNLDGQTKSEIKHILNSLSNGSIRPGHHEAAKKILNTIDQGEQFNRNLVFEASIPLKVWAYIFIYSMVIIFCSKLILNFLAFIVILISMLATLYVLFLTKKFIQKCLSF